MNKDLSEHFTKGIYIYIYKDVFYLFILFAILKGNAKECSNYRTTALISHASKVMLKILQTRCQQYVNHKFPDVQAGFKKGRELEMKLPTSAASSKKQESFRKPSAAAAAKSLQLCPTLCDPIDSSSPPGSPIPGILQARTLEWVAISFSSA